MTDQELINNAKTFLKDAREIEYEYCNKDYDSKTLLIKSKKLKNEMNLLKSSLNSIKSKDTEFKEELFTYLREVLSKSSRLSINNYYDDFIFDVIDYMSYETSYPTLSKIHKIK